MRYEVTIEDRRFRVDVTSGGRFTIDGRAVPADVTETVHGVQWSILIDGESHEITLLTADPLRLDVDGHDVRATAVDERALRAGHGAAVARVGRVEVRAPMPGLLKAVHVREGDTVEPDATLVTLEAMKMENDIVAPIRGRVTRLMYTAGTKVEGGAVLAVLAQDSS